MMWIVYVGFCLLNILPLAQRPEENSRSIKARDRSWILLTPVLYNNVRVKKMSRVHPSLAWLNMPDRAVLRFHLNKALH